MPTYLDHNATTPMHPEVLEAMMPYMSGIYGNPSSLHRFGRLTRDALEQARMQVASLVGAQPKEVIFTSGGTEANNLAVQGVLQKAQAEAEFAISAIEHASLNAPAKHMSEQGRKLQKIMVDSQGVISVDALQRSVNVATHFVSIMAANNETGVIQDLAELIKSAKSINNKLIFHTDACQLAGKRPLSFSELKLDLMSLSSHKLYGPTGAGALVVANHVDLNAQILGGGQEKQKRSGTQNLLSIIGFGAAAELAGKEMQQRINHVEALQMQLQEQLNTMPEISIFSAQADRLPNTLMFALAGIDGEALLMLLDRKGFAVSSGSACDSGSTDPSHVLLAMSVKPDTAKGAIRVSFGEQNTRNDVLRLIEALKEIKQQFN